MEPGRGPDRADVDPTLTLVAWRRKATDLLLAATAAIHLPLIVVVMLGHGPPTSPIERSIGLAAYFVIAAMALLRPFGHRSRLFAGSFAGYLAVALATLAFPRGPYAQIGLVALPILALVLLGSRAARIAILTSGIILVSAPFARVLPGVARALAVDPARAVPPDLVWFQTAVVAAFLVCLMVILDRFHTFLLHSLAAQRRATADLEREAAERSAAQRKMEHEMRERQRLEREVAAIGDEERHRLGQELHDSVCQQLTATLLRCQALDRRVERGGTLSGADLAPLLSLLVQTLDEAHNVAVGLCPLESHPEALAPALRTLTGRIQEMTAAQCEFLSAGNVQVPDPKMAQHLYRIAQEALSNAVRHAHANRIAVELRGRELELILQVKDDGVGLPREIPGTGMGLRTMAYRTEILQGELTVAPLPGGGTCVVCRVPRSADEPAASGDQRWIPAM
ncbi:MAG: sensor histidine kinase [Acidobacteriales bacterium]|nr:sensor histidine kinase [Terriglobales bacterium]